MWYIEVEQKHDSMWFLDKIKIMSATVTLESKKESLGIVAAVILSLDGLTVIL